MFVFDIARYSNLCDRLRVYIAALTRALITFIYDSGFRDIPVSWYRYIEYEG